MPIDTRRGNAMEHSRGTRWNPAPWRLDADTAQVLDARENVVCTINVDRRGGRLDTTDVEANGCILAESTTLYEACMLALEAVGDLAAGRTPNLELVGRALRNATSAARGEKGTAVAV